jgi:hypothetical protein
MDENSKVRESRALQIHSLPKNVLHSVTRTVPVLHAEDTPRMNTIDAGQHLADGVPMATIANAPHLHFDVNTMIVMPTPGGPHLVPVWKTIRLVAMTTLTMPASPLPRHHLVITMTLIWLAGLIPDLALHHVVNMLDMTADHTGRTGGWFRYL